MTTINNILNFFEIFSPLETAMSFVNLGLLFGYENTVVKNALLSLEKL